MIFVVLTHPFDQGCADDGDVDNLCTGGHIGIDLDGKDYHTTLSRLQITQRITTLATGESAVTATPTGAALLGGETCVCRNGLGDDDIGRHPVALVAIGERVGDNRAPLNRRNGGHCPLGQHQIGQ